MAAIQPCQRNQLPPPGSVPVGTTGTLLDEGNLQVYNTGYEWVAYIPGVALTQLTGDVSTDIGGGIQPAQTNVRSADPDVVAVGRWWFKEEGTTPHATVYLCVVDPDGVVQQTPVMSF